MTQKVVGFIVDTNSYSGNFEREMCAFMTGVVGECEVGAKYADRFLNEFDEELNFITDKPDEHGCYRPVQICPTAGVWNNGMGFYYGAGQEELALEHWKNNMILRHEKQLEELRQTTDGDSDVAQKIKSDIQKCKETTEPAKNTVHQSILIHVHREPTADEIALLKERAELFGKEEGIEITGYRLLFEERESNTLSI